MKHIHRQMFKTAFGDTSIILCSACINSIPYLLVINYQNARSKSYGVTTICFFLQFQVRNFWLIQFGNGAQLNYRIYLNLVKIKRKKREKYKVLQQLGGTTDINICQLTHKRCYYEQTWQHTETAAC